MANHKFTLLGFFAEVNRQVLIHQPLAAIIAPLPFTGWDKDIPLNEPSVQELHNDKHQYAQEGRTFVQ